MSSAGTTMPGRAWISNKPPTYVTAPAFKNEDGNKIETSPDLFKATPQITYDPARPGGTIFQGRTFNTFKKNEKRDAKKSNLITQPSEKGKQYVRFSDLEPEPTVGREVVTTEVGGLTIKTTKPYETIIAERDALLETEAAYRRRIKHLEEENAQVLLDYDGLYTENNILREKMDKGEDNNIESYQRVFTDRQILREAETAYKRRINQLDTDAKDLLKNFESLYKENKVLREKAKKLEGRLNEIDRLDDVKRMSELEKKVKQLEKTIRIMGYEKQESTKEKNELENQMYKLREDVADLNRKSILLERENEGLNRGFMALGKNGDNRWNDEKSMKTRRQEEEERLLREEHKNLKKEVEDVLKTNHNLEKINVELRTKNELYESNKVETERRLLELAKDSRTRTPSAEKRRKVEIEEEKAKQIKEVAKAAEELKNENVQLKTKLELLNKEKENFDERLEKAAKQPRETASSIRRKMETEREMRDLTNHVDTLKEKIKRLEVENTDLHQEMQRMEIETKAMKQASNAIASGQASHTENQIKDLNSKIISLNEEIKTLTEENLQNKTDYTLLQERLGDQVIQLQKDKDEIQKEKDTLQENMAQSNDSSVGKIQEMQDEANALQVEFQLLKPKYQELTNTHEEMKAEKEKLIKSLEEKNKEIDELKEVMRSDKNVYNDLAQSKRENANLNREMEELNNSFKNERMKMETDLEELLKNQEFMNTALAEHKVRLDMLQQEKVDLKSENVKLVKANERQAKQLIDLEVDKERISGEGSSVTKELKEEVESLNKQLKKSDKELIQAVQELEVVKNEKENQVSKLLKQMDKLKSEREIETRQLKDQSDSLRSEVGRLKVFEERMASMEKDLKELIVKLTETEERNKALTDQRLANLNNVVKEMKDENLANRIRAAEREDNELEKHKMELEIKQDAITEIRKLKEENRRLLTLLEDKRAAEEAEDEWTRKKNKFNEIVAQNKRLELENKRMLSLFEQSKSDTLKQDLQSKTEKLKLVESQFQNVSIENANLKKIIGEKDTEIKRVEANIDKTNKTVEENKKMTLENNRLRGEISQKDNIISQLKELENTKAKYLDSAANNQRLYEENKRLRDTIDKSKDYQSEFQRAKEQERFLAAKQAKSVEENTLLKSTLQLRERELIRDVEINKERANNLQARNKRLVDEMARLKNDISKKDDTIIKLRDLESASSKYKDAAANINRLSEENQRLRNVIENMGGWKGHFQNVKSLQSAVSRDNNLEQTTTAVYKDKRSDQQAAVYIDTSDHNQKQNTESSDQADPPSKADRILTNRKGKKPQKEESSISGFNKSTSSSERLSKRAPKVKPMTKLPEINKEITGLTYGRSYMDLHKKNRPTMDPIQEEMSQLKLKLRLSETESKQTIQDQSKEIQELMKEKVALQKEITKLKRRQDVRTVADSVDRAIHLEDQNQRLQTENQRLRDELGIKVVEPPPRVIPGAVAATYMDTKPVYTTYNTKEQLRDALDDNRRLSDENNRLQVALEHVHQMDTGSRFKSQQVVGKIIDGFKDAKSKNWASPADSKSSRQKPTRQYNETDDIKLMKLEEY